MRGKLYEGDALFRLCDAPNLADLAAVLAPDQPVGNSIALQRYLTSQHIAALYTVAKQLDGWEGDMFLWMLRRYQVENLKIILRAWATKAPTSALSLYTVSVPEPLDLPAEMLMQQPTMQELVLAIPDPQIREGALMGLADFEESGRPFFIEAGIDKAYFHQLRKLAGDAPGDEEAAARKLIDLELDIYNVMTLLRALFNYSVSFSKIRPFLAPPGTVPISTIEQMRNAPDMPTATTFLPSVFFEERTPPLSGDELEIAFWTKLHRSANRVFYTSVLTFGAVAAFYYIKRVELANLIRISECIRYGERGDAVRQKLVTLRPTQVAGAR